ncbi:MAG: hypothetical protein GXO85_10680 [Chlorobi bacterium]|nr:hypothetical protein [Chlorobiota bacterium]
MKKTSWFNKITIGALLWFLMCQILYGQSDSLTNRTTLLKVVTGINFTFKYYANKIWPGYDLSNQQYIAYMPGNFVLFLNASHAPKDFKPYPSDWSDIGTSAYIYYGTYDNLIGQFAFDYKIDSITTFAMGIPKDLLFSFDNPTYMLFSSTIHEGFHQYQHDHFGEIPWSREELYPILDVENTALASLEMQILKEALKAMFKNNEKQMETLVKEFVAVREYRWAHASDFVRKYEQGQEINEGTARYVEMKAMSCFFKLDTIDVQNQLFGELKRDMSNMTIEDLLIGDMNERLSGLAVAPDDMLRNRIYPVGAALGFLADNLGINWKMKFQAAGTNISFPGLLKNYFKLNDSTQLLKLFENARKDFHYPKIISSAKQLILRYFTEYKKALKKFNHQKGIRVEINLSNNGLQRFRSTKDKKWIVENGNKLLCLHYNLYSLKSIKNNDILLEIRDRAIYDQNNWEKRTKKVVFYTNSLSNVILDESLFKTEQDIKQNFQKIKLKGDNFNFEANTQGNIYISRDKKVVININ